MWCFVCLVVSISAIDCPERLVSEMTRYVSSGTLNPIHSPTHADHHRQNTDPTNCTMTLKIGFQNTVLISYMLFNLYSKMFITRRLNGQKILVVK